MYDRKPRKKCGFVIDTNVSRCRKYIVDYAQTIQPNKPIKEALYYTFYMNILNICDNDWEPNKPKDIDEIWESQIDTLFDKELSNNFQKIFNNYIDKITISYNSLLQEDKKYINNLYKLCRKGTKRSCSIKEIDGQNINNGTKEKQYKEHKEDSAIQEQETITIETVCKFKNILKYIIPLLCFLTRKNNDYTIENMIQTIKNDNKRMHVLQEQTNNKFSIAYNNESLENIMYLYNKYIISNSTIHYVPMYIKELFKENSNNPNALKKIVDEYLEPTQLQKDKQAEISTPAILKEDMLNTVPNSFWKTPKKVFEPACGKGGFVVDIAEKFYYNLDMKFETNEERWKYILENCIYFADISQTNIYIVQELLNGSEIYRLNYYLGDTTQLETKDIQNIFTISEGFDAVIANPPFNHPSKNTGNTLWQTFVKNSLNKWTAYGGYFVCIHPPGWRKPVSTNKENNNGMFELMTYDNTMLELYMNDIKQGEKIFNCSTPFDWYIIQKKNINTYNTYIKTYHNEIYKDNLKQWKWFPNYKINEIKKLIANKNDENCPVIYSRNLYSSEKSIIRKNYTNDYVYPVIHSITQKGPQIRYSSKNLGHFGIKKVIFGKMNFTQPIKDLNGDYGLTEGSIALEVNNDDDEATKIIKALQSKEFKEIVPCITWAILSLDWRIFECFKRNWYEYFI